MTHASMHFAITDSFNQQRLSITGIQSCNGAANYSVARIVGYACCQLSVCVWYRC